MLTKKKPIILTVLAASALLLAGCDDFEAKPTSQVYDAPILNLENDIPQNTISLIYDALVTAGDTNSERVLNNILYIYAESQYGSFFDKTSENGTVIEGLRSVVESGDAAKIKAFAETYPAYEGDSTRVTNFYKDVLYRIRSVFYGYVLDANYQDRSRFVEKKFYDAQIASYYDIAMVDGDIYPYNRGSMQVEGTFVLSEDIVEPGPIKLDGGNRMAAGDIENAYFKDIFGTYQNYIESAVLPDIYRNELTVQYLYTVNRTTLELSSARKVHYIALPDNADYIGATRDLMVSYAHNIVEGSTHDDSVYDLNFLDSLYGGYDYVYGNWEENDPERYALATKIYQDANWTTDTVTIGDEQITYYVQSSYGKIMSDYKKLSDSRFLDDTTVRSEFTSNGTYTVQTGLMIKTNALRAEDHTTDGWFANASAMDDSYPFSSDLFDTRVANEVDSVKFENGAYQNSTASDGLEYGVYRNGQYYMTTNNENGSDISYIALNDGTYYMTIVDEAVKRAKVNSSYEDQYYDGLEAHKGEEGSFAEMVLRKIGYSLSSSETWTSSAHNYYVEKMATIFHDTYVYDYFVKTFPDIFD